MPLDTLTLSVLISVLLTCITVSIEIIYLSQARIRACISSRFALYFLVQAVGNGMATLLASVFLADKFPESIQKWNPLIFAFFGVFAFEGIMSNTNLTFFDKGVLTIQNWVNKGRDPAVAYAIKQNAQFEENEVIRCAHRLRDTVPLNELNVYLSNTLTAAELATIEADAAKSGSDTHLYKALELSRRNPSQTAAILKEKKRRM